MMSSYPPRVPAVFAPVPGHFYVGRTGGTDDYPWQVCYGDPESLDPESLAAELDGSCWPTWRQAMDAATTIRHLLCDADPALHCFREDGCARHEASPADPSCCCCGYLPEDHSGCDCDTPPAATEAVQ